MDSQILRRFDAHEARIAELEKSSSRTVEMLEALVVAVGSPPNPLGRTEEERAGSGLCRIAYETHDGRRFAARLVGIITGFVGAVLALAQGLRLMGIIK